MNTPFDFTLFISAAISAMQVRISKSLHTTDRFYEYI